MEALSKDILSELMKWGYHIDTPNFLFDGRLAGESTRMAYKEILASELGVRLYEGEDSNGNTLLIFMSAYAGMGRIKEKLGSKINAVYMSKELTTLEKNALFED